MNVAAEMRLILIEAAEPRGPQETIRAAILRASRVLGLRYARARALWYGDARVRVRAEEADALRVARRALAAQRIARLQAKLAEEQALLDGLNRKIGGMNW